MQMKTTQKAKSSFKHAAIKNLTLGDLIASIYGACGEKGAGKLLQLAMEAHVIRFTRSRGMACI